MKSGTPVVIHPISEIYLLYARLFDFPTPQLAKAARDGSIGSALSGMHRRAGIPSPPSIRATLKTSDLEQIYISTFEVGIPEPPVPLYETAYISSPRQQVLEDILRFYEFFDLKPLKELREMPDHLTLELEFMASVGYMEELALKQGGQAEPFRLAQRDFLERHLFPMLNFMKTRNISEPFYKGLLAGILAFVKAHLRKLNKVACY